MASIDTHGATPKPKVFISYAHEGELVERVGELAEWLRENGVEPITDHLYPHRPPDKGWRPWMQHSIEDADVVLIVCSERYKLLFEKREDIASGGGCGVTWESAIITSDLYDSRLTNSRFFPILPDGGEHQHVPTVLKDFHNGHYFPSGNQGILALILNDSDVPLSKTHETALQRGKPAASIDSSQQISHDVTIPGSWPEIGVSFTFRVANHLETQEAFQHLLQAEARYRLLLLQGDSCTGKTHLINQFLTVALDLAGLRCGRFDFKGTTDLDMEINSLAFQLDLPPPASGSLVSRFAELLLKLKSDPCPTLLIFDSFEVAGEAEDWVRKSLLLAMMRLPWLRLVICGQRTLATMGEPWETRRSHLIRLRQPTPEEWLAFGIDNQPDLTLEKIVWACNCLSDQKDKTSLIAQMLSVKR
ncbi:MAG: toll/interleukin-1 receptor domain-containing protein [Cyanobacteriota bacterium]|nr:toll/interleukin-1 receptor domain-containing protein [Cyanobacteriota bacterium]